MTDTPPYSDESIEAPGPLPVEALDYAAPMPRRPGVLTAIGIISIVLAALYGLTGLSSVASTLAFYSMSRITTVTPTPQVMPTPPATGAAPATDLTLGFADRSAAVDGIALQVPLDARRRAMVDALFQQPDVDIVPRPESGEPLTPEAVASQITGVTAEDLNAGQAGTRPEPANTGKGAGDDAYPKGAKLDLPTGTLHVSDKLAFFIASDGVIVSAAPYTGTVQVNGPPSAGLRNYPVNGTGAGSGQIGVGRAPVPFATPSLMKISGPTAALALADAGLRLVLAVWLLVAGILVVRDSPRGRPWHVRWAWVKLPTAVLGGAVYWWWMSEMMSGFTSAMAAAGGTGGGAGASFAAMNGAWIIAAAFQVVIACAYPVAVLVVMSLASVRGHYAGLRGEGSPRPEDRHFSGAVGAQGGAVTSAGRRSGPWSGRRG